MSFMMRIDAAQRSPLEQLAVDYFHAEKTAHPTIDFCRRVHGVPDDDEKVAMVRGWRDLGRRANPGSCL